MVRKRGFRKGRISQLARVRAVLFCSANRPVRCQFVRPCSAGVGSSVSKPLAKFRWRRRLARRPRALHSVDHPPLVGWMPRVA